ncbi:MAG: UDP-N-acetylglucosamine 1-carboxyvinyltransferase [Defluviitaleaceae bacterium]|nr:UDP-N-acetylglucosamine 1-carboxyvinyltransferase [Defluviitaleaceae bacterium]
MCKYSITGGRRLEGETSIGGCKNAVLPILAATVAVGARSIIHGVPDISDTHVSMDILRHLGCDVVYDGHVMVVDSSGASGGRLPEKQARSMRSSILFAGAQLGRFRSFDAPHPGGCKLGARPIDIHISAFKQMGAKFESDVNSISAHAKRLRGANIILDFPSVGATQNIILASVLADGYTLIQNAAREPEIVDLQGFLRAAGAYVAGAGTSTIVVKGVKKLHEVEYEIMPDRIVAGTYLAAGAITRGIIRLNNVNHEDILPATDVLKGMGVKLVHDGSSLVACARGVDLRLPKKLVTGCHPEFPTDMQPQFTALFATALGECLIEENVFEARSAHIPELNKMGADIVNINDNRFHVKGVERLNGEIVTAKDLRSGAALVLAGLAADGNTIVREIEHIQRGYEALDKDLQALGADITLIDNSDGSN